MVGGGKVSKRLADMSPGSKANLTHGYRKEMGRVENPFDTEGAEHKATQRARAAIPGSPRKRSQVLLNLLADDASHHFVETYEGGNPKEIRALQLLGENIRVAMQAYDKGSGNLNEVRHLRKLVGAVIGSKATRTERLVSLTAQLCGIDRHRLVNSIGFRDRVLDNDINAIFAVQVLLIRSLVLLNLLVLTAICEPIEQA